MATNGRTTTKSVNNCGDKRGLSPNSLKNLKGNRTGRPAKDVSITSLLKLELDKIPPGEKQGRTWRQLLVLAWLATALKNPVMFKELLDRIEGKVVQPVGGDGGGPIEVKITVSSENA